MRVLAIGSMLMLSLLAGCTDSGSPSDSDATGVDGDDADTQGPGADGAEAMEPIVNETDPITSTFNLTSNMELSDEEANAGSIQVPVSTTGNGGLDESEILRFESDPFTKPAIIQADDVEVTVWVESRAPVVATGFYDFGGWVGSTINLAASGVQTIGPGVLAPDTPTELEWTLDVPVEDGIFVPVGESFVFEFGTGLVDEDGGLLDLLVGPDHPSRVTITWTHLSIDILEGVDADLEKTFTGHFEHNGAAYFFTPAQPTENTAEHTISVPEDAAVVRVDSDVTSTGRSDLDMTILDGSTIVGASRAFYAHEGILLAGPTLEPHRGKDLTLQVNNYAGSNVDYTIDLSIGTIPL